MIKLKFAGEDEQPLVSVCIITYNHEKWITAAIDSVLEQETDFPCEVIIADDCSTDSTREILKGYAKKYPIKLILQKKNKGAKENWKDLMKAPTGKYIAYFEGDDAWVHPLKLQKQVDVLKTNPHVSLCYSNATIVDTKNPALTIFFSEKSKPKQLLNKYDVINHCVIPTCTMTFLNKMKEIPDWYYQTNAGDYFLVYLLSKWGEAYYQNEVFGLHNHHYNGVSAMRNMSKSIYEDTVLSYRLLDHLGNSTAIKKILLGRHIQSINYIFHRKSFLLAIQLFWKLPFRLIAKVPKDYTTILKLCIKVHCLLFFSRNIKTAV